MIGTIDVKVQAHNPNFPLDPVFTFVNSSQSFRIRDVPKRIGNWSITNVFVNITYPDNTVISKECVLTGGVWVGTVDGCSSSGQVEKGFVVTASGIDENNQTVSNYVLGAGDIYVKQLDGTVTPGTTATRMYFYETIPTSPNEGDSTFIEGVLNVYDGTQWKPVAQQSDPSYIEDSDGNKIEADLDCHVKNLTLPWTFNGVQLKYKYDFHWEYERNDQKYELHFLNSSLFPSNTWSLVSLTWNGSDWDIVESDFVNGSIDETSLYFGNFGETATRSIIETNRLALISEVPTSFDKIQDSVGNVINANRNVTKIEFGDYCWQYTTTGSPGNIYVMTGTKELSEYYVNATDKYQLSYDNNTWSLKFIFNGTTLRTLTSEGNLTDTDLTFTYNNVIFDFTWKQATTEVSDTVALVSQIPTKTSDLTNDSGFITVNEVPTPDKIEDSNENRINANRTFIKVIPQTQTEWKTTINNVEYTLHTISTAPGAFSWQYTDTPSVEGSLRLQLNYIVAFSRWSFIVGRYTNGRWSYTQSGQVDASKNVEQLSYQETEVGDCILNRTVFVNGEMASKDDIPTKTSDLTNDSGFITLAQVPTPAYIENDGNTINADRTWELSRPDTANWTLNYPSILGENVTLSYDSDWEFWGYEGDNHKQEEPKRVRIELSFVNGNWAIASEHWDENTQQWIYNEDLSEVSGESDVEELQFSNGASISRTLSGSGTLALTSEVPTKTSDLTNDSGFITSSYPVKNDGGITKAKAMTEQAYEALQTKDSTTLYVITEN